jgi:F-type H+-transporting ATPase subunit alpha
MELLGRVVDALGNPIDGNSLIGCKISWPPEPIALGMITRKTVSQPLQTGILGINRTIPIGRGQSELIIGDRSVEKGSIPIDTIINQANINRKGLAGGDSTFRLVYSRYVAIAQKNSIIA